ncbi:hypothetical protein ES703_114567 [subsurface metagenome]
MDRDGRIRISLLDLVQIEIDISSVEIESACDRMENSGPVLVQAYILIQYFGVNLRDVFLFVEHEYVLLPFFVFDEVRELYKFFLISGPHAF